jgi:hypothetical protein
VHGRTKQPKTQGLLKNIEQRKKNLRPSSESRNSKRNILISAFRNKNVNLKKLNEIITDNKNILNFKITEVNNVVNKLKNKIREISKAPIINNENVRIGFPNGPFPVAEEVYYNGSNGNLPLAQGVPPVGKIKQGPIKMPGQMLIDTAKEQIARSEVVKAKQLLSGLLRNMMNTNIRMTLSENDKKYLEDYRKFRNITNNSKIFDSMFNSKWNPTDNQLTIMRQITTGNLNKFLTSEQLNVFKDKLREKTNVGSIITDAVEKLGTGNNKERTRALANLRGVYNKMKKEIPLNKLEFMALFNTYNKKFINPENVKRFAKSSEAARYLKNYDIFMTQGQKNLFKNAITESRLRAVSAKVNSRRTKK